MIVFTMRIGPADNAADNAARDELERWRSQYSLLTSTPVEEWSSEDATIRCLWTSHRPEHLGGVRYTATAPGRFALFSGRPVRWHDDEADGRAGIDARTYLDDPSGWSSTLDGRFAVVRADERTVHVQTDAAGFHPLYESRRDGTTRISNIAGLVTPAGARQRHRAAAALLAAGWSFTGEPLSADVDRLPAGTLLELGRDGSRRSKVVHALSEEHFKSKPDYEEAARRLVALSRGLADWPGRPRYLSISGGIDSRLIAASMRRAGVPADSVTIAFGGLDDFPETHDVVLGRQLASLLGLRHRVVKLDETTPLFNNPCAIIGTARLTSPGATALNYMKSLMLEEPALPVPINHDGAGGEVARASLGHHPDATTVEAMTDSLFRYIIPRDPTPLVHADGLDLLRQWVREFVEQRLAAGIHLQDVPDVMMFQRTLTEHGPTTTNFEYGEDAVSALASHHFWPHIFGQPREDRKAERFHRELLGILGPDLMELPIHTSRYAVDDTGEGGSAEVAPPRARSADERAGAEDPIVSVHRYTRLAVADQPGHDAWDLLDRSRVDDLLRADPSTLSSGSEHQLWRLATLFCRGTEEE